MKTLDVIIPVYNEEKCIDETVKKLQELKKTLENELLVSFIFVNDGSVDNSHDILKNYAEKFDYVKVINFSRNFGHQFAISAGIDYTNADYAAIIDADLQDPPQLINDMYKKSLEGFQIVYGKRIRRKNESSYKKITASLFYKFFNVMCSLNIPNDTGDFRLITKDVITSLKNMKEKNRFIRGMVPWTGFKSTPLEYDRDERYAGETKYSLIKMSKLALDAVFSFSVKPLAVISFMGLGLLVLSILCLILDEETICAILFAGALQLFALAIIGAYIGRIYEETKNRPLYIVKDTINL